MTTDPRLERAARSYAAQHGFDADAVHVHFTHMVLRSEYPFHERRFIIAAHHHEPRLRPLIHKGRKP